MKFKSYENLSVLQYLHVVLELSIVSIFVFVFGCWTYLSIEITLKGY